MKKKLKVVGMVDKAARVPMEVVGMLGEVVGMTEKAAGLHVEAPRMP